MEAKIISYDNVNGKGILITKENEKIDFSIDKWNSFDTLPEIGLLVEIDENSFVSPKKDFNKEKLDELKNVKQKYINGSIANGWRLINENEESFIIEEKISSFSYLYCIVLIFLLSIPLGLLFGVFGFVVALIFSIMIARNEKTTTLRGVYNYEKFEINITKDNEFYKKLTIKEDDDVTPPAMFKVVSNSNNKEESKVMQIIIFASSFLIVALVVGFIFIIIKSYL